MNDRSLFLAALDIEDPAARLAYLEKACAGDAALRQRVDALLAASNRSGSFMNGPVLGDITSDYEPMTEGPGTRVGQYKLLQQIGEGGMGTVFMAEQEEPVRRKVALKIIKPGMDSKQVVARFEAERQALSMMDHPNIAKVLDAGTTATGRPFFVMELVHGVPITEFCDVNKLSPRERLNLFIPVCQAIQHAHIKGIIHRDIKPSNVMVTMYDDKPVPKVIDFGVAKAIEQRLTEKSLFTQYGALVGTFEYMSPEQAEMNAFGVDTRSDVYSLGVLLYELLTGTTPLEKQRLRTAALGEVVRLIKEEEAPRPSLRISESGTLEKVAAARKTEPGKLSSLVRGELDWIVMRCLEKDRTRRYDTAVGLAKDVERYLKDEPVEACPPTLGYRLKKTYRKNKTAVRVGSAFVCLALGAALMGMYLAVQARRAEQLAMQEQAIAEEARQDALAAQSQAIQRGQALEQKNEQLLQTNDLQRRTRYAAEMNLLQAAYDAKDTAAVMRLLKAQVPANGEADLRGPEWHFWHRKFHSHETEFRVPCSKMVVGNWSRGSFHGLGLSPDGGTAVLAQCGNAGGVTIQVWDAVRQERKAEYRLVLDQGPPIYTQAEVLRFSPNGRKVLVERRVSSDEYGIITGNYSRRAYLINLANGAAQPIEDADTDGSYTATEFSEDLSVAVFRRIDVAKKQTHLRFQRLDDRKDLGTLVVDGYSRAKVTTDHRYALVRSVTDHQVFEPKNLLPEKRQVIYSYWKLGAEKPLWSQKLTELADGICRLSHDGRGFYRTVLDDTFWRLIRHELSTGREHESQIVASSADAVKFTESEPPTVWILSDDERRIAYQTRTGLTVCDLGVARQVRIFAERPLAPSQHLVESFDPPSDSFAFLPDGRLAATWSGYELWSNSRVLGGYRRQNTADFFTDNLLIRTWKLPAFGSEAETAFASNLSPDGQMHALAPNRRVGAGPAGKITDRVSVVKTDGTCVFDVDLRTQRVDTTDYNMLIASIGFSADSRYLYHAGEFAFRWEYALKSGDPFIVWDLSGRKEVGRAESPPGTTFFNNWRPKPLKAGDHVLLKYYRKDAVIEGGINGSPTPQAAGAKIIEFPSCRTLFDITVPETVKVEHLAIDTGGIIVGYADRYLGRSDGKTVSIHEWDGTTGRYRGPSERKWPIFANPELEPGAETWVVRGDRAVHVTHQGGSAAEVWDANRRGPQDQLLFRIPINGVCELSPDGSRLLVAESRSRTQSDAVMYCTTTGRVIWSRTWPDQMDSMATFAKWSPDGQQFWYGVDSEGKPVGYDFRPREPLK
jgi:serine/threonine protein kinase